MKKIAIFLTIFLLSVSFSYAHGDDIFDEAKNLIDSGIGCDQLTDNDLEIIGDYFMEQIHSGDAHIQMDQMMGGEGSERLRQMHIMMGIRFYCNNAGIELNETQLPLTSYEMMNSGMMEHWYSGEESYLGLEIMALLFIAACIYVIKYR